MLCENSHHYPYMPFAVNVFTGVAGAAFDSPGGGCCNTSADGRAGVRRMIAEIRTGEFTRTPGPSRATGDNLKKNTRYTGRKGKAAADLFSRPRQAGGGESTVEGTVESVTFANERTGWSVIRMAREKPRLSFP